MYVNNSQAIIIGFLVGILIAIIGLALVLAGGWGPCGPASNMALMGGLIISIGMRIACAMGVDAQFPVNLILLFVIQGLLCAVIAYVVVSLKLTRRIARLRLIIIIIVSFGVVNIIHFLLWNP